MIAWHPMGGASGQSCIPNWIHTILAERRRAEVLGIASKAFKKSGCGVNADGVVPCPPEDLRAYTETMYKSLGLWPGDRALPLDVYSLARNIRSEAGSGSISEKVAMAAVAMNRMRDQDKTMSQMTMRNGTRYARQSGQNPSVASSQDPRWEEIVIADLAMRGTFGDWVRGAVLYFSPNDQDGLYRAGRVKDDRWDIYERWSSGWGSSTNGYAWIGPLAGVNHNEQFLMRKLKKIDPAWREMYALGKLALGERGVPAIAKAGTCDGDTLGTTAGLLATAAVAMMFGAGATFALRYVWGVPVPTLHGHRSKAMW